MPASTEILIEADAWDEARLTQIAQVAFDAALADAGLGDAEWSVSVLACDDARISELNRDFRAKAGPTNVLSWPSAERGADTPGGTPNLPDPTSGWDDELGDIAISHDTCLREAEVAGKPFEQHLTHLLVHALLHLLGYDHENDADAALMEAMEVRILASLGHPDPYKEDHEASPANSGR